MAQLQICKYCGKNALDSQWHQGCRQAALEGLLYQVQKVLRRGDNLSGGRMFEQEILNETFCSKEEIEKKFKKVEELELAKERWKDAFHKEMQKFAIRWQEEHPDPDPPTC
ncbi:MAG: hypothetical protein WC673_02855 [Candidatus Paceibacterota bacterium]|jgi:hypothetical protein